MARSEHLYRGFEIPKQQYQTVSFGPTFYVVSSYSSPEDS